MKIVKFDDYEVDVIVESDKYIDIYTYYDYNEYNSLTTDNGKGWRLHELDRLDLETGVRYNMTADPNPCGFDGHGDYTLEFTKDGVKYGRVLLISFDDMKDTIGYITQDLCNSRKKLPLTDELKGKTWLGLDDLLKAGYIDKDGVGRVRIDIEDDMCELFQTHRDDFGYNEYHRLNDYIFDSSKEFEGTNKIFQDFYNFSKSIYVFGCEGEEPRVLEIVGKNKPKYIVESRGSGPKKVKCINPNKYKYVKAPRWEVSTEK